MEQSRHGQGITSVKVHHQPGGNQSFNIFGGEEPVKQHKPAVVPNVQNQQQSDVFNAQVKNQQVSSISFGQEEVKSSAPAISQQQMQNQPVQRTSADSGAIDESGNPVMTSVKVHAPPGGKSNFTLG